MSVTVPLTDGYTVVPLPFAANAVSSAHLEAGSPEVFVLGSLNRSGGALASLLVAPVRSEERVAVVYEADLPVEPTGGLGGPWALELPFPLAYQAIGQSYPMAKVASLGSIRFRDSEVVNSIPPAEVGGDIRIIRLDSLDPPSVVLYVTLESQIPPLVALVVHVPLAFLALIAGMNIRVGYSRAGFWTVAALAASVLAIAAWMLLVLPALLTDAELAFKLGPASGGLGVPIGLAIASRRVWVERRMSDSRAAAPPRGET